jgi:cardiolipin synthase A/B
MDLLIAKAKEGVEIRLIIDALGNNKGPTKRLAEFEAAGGKYSLFHGTLAVILSPRKNNRNHRKLAVIDGTIAYVGGFNIGDEYLGLGPLGYWRDSGIRMEGLSVFTVQTQILADWYYASMEDVVTERRFYEDVKASDDVDGVQIVSGGPDCSRDNPIQTQYTSIIWKAEETLYMHTPYLSPNDSLVGALKTAAYRGVDVRIIIPDKPDHPFVYWNNIYYADKLMSSGVRVFMYNRGFVHS